MSPNFKSLTTIYNRISNPIITEQTLRMKTLLFTTLAILPFFSLSQQNPVDVTDQTIKIGGMKEEILYFGFEEGDQIVLNFEEIDGKELKEIEVLEYPSISKYSDFKVSNVVDKTIRITHKSIYAFRFYNGAVSGRICKIRIHRIPANEQTKDFNSAVIWVTKQDTTWNTYTKDVIVGYDTTYKDVTKKELVKTELKEEILFDKMQKVHSQTNENGNKTWVFFTLPQNQPFGYETKKVVSWAYWVGVGEEANNAWKKNVQAISGIVQAVATYYTTPLGGHLAGHLTSLVLPQSGEDVIYALVNEENKNLFMGGYTYSAWDHGKGIASYKKFTDPGLCSGKFYVVLANDNYALGIDVSVKVSAMIEINTYEDKNYTEEHVKPRYEKKIFSDPIIKTNQVPVFGK